MIVTENVWGRNRWTEVRSYKGCGCGLGNIRRGTWPGGEEGTNMEAPSKRKTVSKKKGLEKDGETRRLGKEA